MKQTLCLLILTKHQSKHAIHHEGYFSRYASINIHSKADFAHLALPIRKYLLPAPGLPQILIEYPRRSKSISRKFLSRLLLRS